MASQLTLEFKAKPTPAQLRLLQRYLKPQRSVWNVALGVLEEFDIFFKGYKGTEGSAGKAPGGYAPRCPMAMKGEDMAAPACAVEYRFYKVKDGAIADYNSTDFDEWISVPFSRLVSEFSSRLIQSFDRPKNVTTAEKKEQGIYTTPELVKFWGWNGGWGYSCPLKQDIPAYWLEDPIIQSPSFKGKKGIAQTIKGEVLDRMKEMGRITATTHEFVTQTEAGEAIPYKLRSGTISNLAASWDAYNKSRTGMAAGPKRGKPRFKSARDDANTLIHPDPKNSIKPDPNNPNLLRGVPGFGKEGLKVLGLAKRWKLPDGSIPLINLFKICFRPSGVYIQLTGEIPKNRKIRKNSDKAVGIDPGLTALITTDAGKKIKPPKFLRKAEKSIIRKQRKLARKLIKNLVLWLSDSERKIEDITKHGISKEKATKLIEAHPKTEKEILLIINSSQLNRLKYSLESNRAKRLKKEIACRHEKVRMQRRAINHKISTQLVQEYAAIAIEDGVQSANLRKKAKAKLNEDGSGYGRNNKSQKAGLTKSLADAAPGQLIAMIEQKAKDSGRQFKRIAARNSTKECPCCSELNDIALEDRTFVCSKCNYTKDRDQKAGIVILKRAGFEGVRFSEAYQEARTYSCKVEVIPAKPSKVETKRVSRKTKSKRSALPELPAGVEFQQLALDFG